MKFEFSLRFAQRLDKADPLRSFRKRFHLPRLTNKKRTIYFTGNSLGLQPRKVKQYLDEELYDWATKGVEGHFDAKRPWLSYHRLAKKTLAQLVGARPAEVVAMNQLTVNLHLMLTTFYRPNSSRFKIIIESGAFSSDRYAVESHIRWHGLDPATALVEISPKNESCLRTEDIVATIREHGSQVALVMFGGVQYYTGQFFNLPALTKAGHDVGGYVGFDLAHAMGNVPMSLHKDNVDFAVWCSYKYLNAGPGGIAGAYIHERHGQDSRLPRMAGWWGYPEATRFQMKKDFIPMDSVDGWQVSNFPVLSGAALLASLEIFAEARIGDLRRKSLLLTGYLEFVLKTIDPTERYLKIITPSDPAQRGCQLSIFIKQNSKSIFSKITRAGVVADWREPELPGDKTGVIRVAPVPLYNTFEEVYRFGEILRNVIQ